MCSCLAAPVIRWGAATHKNKAETTWLDTVFPTVAGKTATVLCYKSSAVFKFLRWVNLLAAERPNTQSKQLLDPYLPI